MRNRYDGSLMLDAVPLAALGIADAWPELTRLQDEARSLIRRHAEAEREVVSLHAELEAARAKDLAAEASALRQNKKPPEPTHEPRVQSERVAAERSRDRLEVAAVEVLGEVQTYRVENTAELGRDGTQALADRAEELSRSARETAHLYAQVMDSERELKRLVPPEPDPSMENLEAGPSQHVIGIISTPSGPQRGEVEAALNYLASLAQHYAVPDPEPTEATIESEGAGV